MAICQVELPVIRVPVIGFIAILYAVVLAFVRLFQWFLYLSVTIPTRSIYPEAFGHLGLIWHVLLNLWAPCSFHWRDHRFGVSHDWRSGIARALRGLGAVFWCWIS